MARLKTFVVGAVQLDKQYVDNFFEDGSIRLSSFNPVLFTKRVISVVPVGESVASVVVLDFSVVFGSWHTTAPSPKPRFVSLGAVTDEALLASGRAPGEA